MGEEGRSTSRDAWEPFDASADHPWSHDGTFFWVGPRNRRPALASANNQTAICTFRAFRTRINSEGARAGRRGRVMAEGR